VNVQDLNNLDLSDIADWPWPVKMVVVFIVCIGLGIAWYYLDAEDLLLALERTEKQEVSLRQTFEDKQAKAASLDQYKQQLEEMRESFGSMLRQLPNKTEVADLLVDVSQTGLAAGLEFELFKPTEEVPREFYAELPIQIIVSGSYHEFGEFISGLAALPRIVTIHNILITPMGNKKKGDNRLLRLKATAKTYRYLEGEG